MLSPELEELLSSYLDGELSPGERLRAEQLLADQPECRHFLEELRSLRGSLARLPRQAAPPGFAQRVQAEIDRAPARPIAAPAPPADESPRHLASGRRWIRPLVWSSLAIAAALAIMTFSPQQLDEQPGDGAVRVAWHESRESAADQRKPADTQIGAAPASKILPQPVAGEGPRAGGAAANINPSEPADAMLREATPARGQQSSPAALGRNADVPAGAATIAPLLLVQCDLTPDAAQQDAFRNLLSQARITWDSIPLETDLLLQDVEERHVERQESAAAPPAQSTAEPAPAANSTDGTLELVLVEAPPAQLEAMLAQLNSQAHEFPAVLVTPAPFDQSQANWLQYNRAAPQMESSAESVQQRRRNLLRKSRAREFSFPRDEAPSAAPAPGEAPAPASAEQANPAASTDEVDEMSAPAAPPLQAADEAAQTPPPVNQPAAASETQATAGGEAAEQSTAPEEDTVNRGTVDELTDDQRALQEFMTQNSANFAAALRRRTEQESDAEEPPATPRAQRIVLPAGRSIHDLLQANPSPTSPAVLNSNSARRDASSVPGGAAPQAAARSAIGTPTPRQAANATAPLQQAIFLLRVVPQPARTDR